MTFLSDFYRLLSSELAETPTTYGLFHSCWVGIVAILLIVFAILAKKMSDKAERTFLFVTWIVIAVCEILKQFYFSFGLLDDGTLQFSYQWYVFPYQFCSTPLYLLPFAAFLKDGKVRDGILAFLSTFSLFAGVVVVFFFPNDVFIRCAFISCQTMIHHGSQVLVGVFLLVRYRDRLKKARWNYFLGSVAVFAVMSGIALLLDEHIYAHIDASQTCNLFFISRHYPSTLAVLSEIYPIVPYPVFLLIYLLGFSFVAFITYLIGYYAVMRKPFFLKK